MILTKTARPMNLKMLLCDGHRHSENNTEVYIATVEKRSGISRHTILNRNNREQLIAVVAAMSYVENGVPANMDEVRKGWELI